jgi:hypothetical protein
VKIYFSDFFNVDRDVIEEYGAMDVSLINDLPLFVDPFLLFNSKKDHYQELHKAIISYLRFLKSLTAEGVIGQGQLDALYVFPEVRQNWLGYSLVGNFGSGLGAKFARSLHENLGTLLVDLGSESITESTHLEKACLITEGVGRDNISDFTTNLIKGFLLRYTETFAQANISPKLRQVMAVDRVAFNYETRSWESERFDLPFCNGDYVLLTPKDLLTKDDTWICKTDLMRQYYDVVNSIPNEQLRAKLNDYLARQLPKDPSDSEIASAKWSTIRANPALIDYFIRLKELNRSEATSLSRAKVAEVERLFIKQLTDFVTQLSEQTAFYEDGPPSPLSETRARVEFLKDVIENKGGHRLFYLNGKPIEREADLQILFRLTWYGTNRDVSREVNDGLGPVDFKVSLGAYDKSLVEFKLAKNTHLRRNLERQLDIYSKASDARNGLYVILFFSEQQHDRVMKILMDLKLQNAEHIILIDARADNKPSGSKA